MSTATFCPADASAHSVQGTSVSGWTNFSAFKDCKVLGILYSIKKSILILTALLWVHSAFAGTVEDGLSTRYIAESSTWRMDLILFALEGEESRIESIFQSMDDFSNVLRSYITLKRPGHAQASAMLQLNIDNKKEVLGIQEQIEVFRRGYPGFTRAFFILYSLTNEDFAEYSRFQQTYENLMDQWRQELEDAIIQKQANTIRQIQEDMILFRLAVQGYSLFPGEAAGSAREIQEMLDDLAFAVYRLRFHIKKMTGEG